MDEEEPFGVESQRLGDRQLRQEAAVGLPDGLSGERPRGAGQVLEADSAGDDDAVGGPVVVVAADGMMRVAADPVDARDGVDAVIDQVAEEQADVTRLAHRREGRPVRVDVGDDKDAHECLCGYFHSSTAAQETR